MAVLPDFDEAQFEPGAPIDNPFFPLIPGTIFSYSGTDVDEDAGEVIVESNNAFVTFATKEIEGVTATVVRDTEYENGVLIEDTIDWYAQDTEGNVWYLGELTYAFEYDDDGNYLETTSEGSWTAGVDGASAGHIMPAEPGFGAAYYQEFAPDLAEDEAIVVGVDEEVTTGTGTFDGALQTLDTTALEPDQAEFKYYVPEAGLVLEESLDDEGEVEFANELLGVRTVDLNNNAAIANGSAAVLDAADDDDADGVALGDLIEQHPLDGFQEAETEDFQGDGSELQVTFLADVAGFDSAIGAYTFDVRSGEIGEGRILFTSSDDLAAGASASVEVAAGEGLGLFLVPDGADLGLDLSAFEDGDLFFANFLTGEAATLDDVLAPLVTDGEGEVLPITALHALDGDFRDGVNLLNPTAGVQAVDLEAAAAEAAEAAGGEVEVLGFEDLLTTDPSFDGDYNDVVVAVSPTPLGADTVTGLLGELGSTDAAVG